MAGLTVMHLVIDAETGGAQTMIRNLAAYRKAADRITLVVIKGPGALSAELERACDKVYYLGFDSRSFNLPGMLSRLQSLVNATSPEVLHTHLLHCDLLGAFIRQKGLTKISTVHTTGMSRADPLRSRIIGKFVALFTRRFDAVVACSDGAREYMSHTGYSRDNAHTILNGVPIPTISASLNQKNLVNLARWHPMKDHENLFEAFRRSGLRQEGWKLHCAGYQVENSNDDLRNIIESKGLADSIVLHGSIQDVNGLLKNARALIISSSYGEALPMAALESLALGLPVISTDVGAGRSLTLATEMLVPPENSSALAEAMNWICEATPDRLKELSLSAKSKVEADFSIQNVVAKYEELYLSCIANSPRRTLEKGDLQS